MEQPPKGCCPLPPVPRARRSMRLSNCERYWFLRLVAAGLCPRPGHIPLLGLLGLLAIFCPETPSPAITYLSDAAVCRGAP